jgi:hypothetical protein
MLLKGDAADNRVEIGFALVEAGLVINGTRIYKQPVAHDEQHYAQRTKSKITRLEGIGYNKCADDDDCGQDGCDSAAKAGFLDNFVHIPSLF